MAYYYEEQDERNEKNESLSSKVLRVPQAASLSEADADASFSPNTAFADNKKNEKTGYEAPTTQTEAAYTAFSENFKEGISTGWKLGVAGYEYAKGFLYEQPFLTQDQYEKSPYKMGQCYGTCDQPPHLS